MKSLMLLFMLCGFAGLASAQDPANTVSEKLMYGATLKYVPPSDSSDLSACLSSGNETLGFAFVAKYPVHEVWADQFQIVSQNRGGLKYRTRLSAKINNNWVHRVYEMYVTMDHNMSAGSPLLISESWDK